ncbi:tape measure protein [Riemerella anatipestifer]|uniref:Tape measure protein n=1 Tax=Riemerella anatipestifer TaxID=34085 RepID=A0AAP6HG26_RIEAN|nr:tape measure protein [Riemerella anatipestifer]
MANGYEFVIGLKDVATATLQKIGGGVNDLYSQAQKTTDGLGRLQSKATDAFGKYFAAAKSAVKGSDTLKHSVDDLRAKLESVNKVRFGTVLKSEFAQATKEAERLEKQVRRLEQGISGNGIGSKMKGWRNDFANSLPGADLIKNPLTMAGAAMGGLWSATEKSMEAGKEKMKLQNLANTQEVGTALYDGLTKFATDTVFGTEVYDMANQMLANGIKDADVLPIMQQLGDISMGDANKLGSLSLAFAQINGKGKLAGQELLQLINAGFNPLQVLSEKTGESMESLTKRMEQGGISVGEVRKAFDLATGKGGKFHNMLTNVANTPYGKMEGFKGQLEQIMVKIGTVFIPIVSALLDLFSTAADFFGPFIEPLAIGIGALSAGILGLAAAQWAWNLAMSLNPIGLIIMGIVALVAAIAYCIYNIDGWGKAWKHTTEGVKLLFQAFVSGIEIQWNNLVNGLMLGLNKIKEGWYEFKNAVGLGNEAENNAALNAIAQDTNNRKKQIVDGIKKTVALGTAAKNEFGKVGQSLSWKGASMSDVKDGIMSKVMPTVGNKGGYLGGNAGASKTDKKTKGNGTGKQKTDSIISGGSKQMSIIVNIGKLQDQTVIHVDSTEKGLNTLGDKVQEMLLRSVNSVNQLQSG